MKCPRCGNEVSAEEAFCGQCGNPNTPPAQPTEMVQKPLPHSGHLNSYPAEGTFGPQNPAHRQNGQNVQPFANTQRPSLPQQAPSFTPPLQEPASHQQTEFYQDATEAISLPPSNPNARYQQPFSPTPPTAYPQQGGVPGQYGFQASQQPQASQVQPRPNGSYVGQAYPPPQPIQSGLGYNREGRKLPQPPQKQQNGVLVFVVSICLVIALLSAVGVATFYALRGHTPEPQNPSVQTVPTEAPTPTATVAPTTVPSPTVAPTTTIVPTATTPATPPPDANFVYCGQPCATDGFSTEYPQTWTATPLSGVQGIQFANPAAVDQSATFKTPGPTAGASSDLVQMDLQQNFMNKSGYTVVTPNSTVHIGGETWFREVITYQGTPQQEYVEVYGDVHGGKGFILELQASTDQFPAVNTQYFENITGRFLFL